MLIAKPLVEQGLGFFFLLARRVVGADQQVTDDGFVAVAQRRDRDHGRQTTAVLADVGQFVNVFDPARRFEHQCFEAWRDGCIEFVAEGRRTGDQLGRVGDVGRGDLVDHIFGLIAEHALGADVENLDDAVLIGGDA